MLLCTCIVGCYTALCVIIFEFYSTYKHAPPAICIYCLFAKKSFSHLNVFFAMFFA